MLESFAAQAVIAMVNARLLGELRQRTEEVAELNRGLEARVTAQVDRPAAIPIKPRPAPVTASTVAFLYSSPPSLAGNVRIPAEKRADTLKLLRLDRAPSRALRCLRPEHDGLFGAESRVWAISNAHEEIAAAILMPTMHKPSLVDKI